MSRWHAHRSAAIAPLPIPRSSSRSRGAHLDPPSPVGQGLDGRRRLEPSRRGEAEERETMEEASHGDGGAWRLALGGRRPTGGRAAGSRAAVSRWLLETCRRVPFHIGVRRVHEDTRRSAMANSGRQRRGGGDHARAVAALIRLLPPRRAVHLPPRQATSPHVRAAASSEGARADEAERRHSPSAVASRGRRTWRRGNAGAGGGISPAGRAPLLPMHLPLSRVCRFLPPLPTRPFFSRRAPPPGPLLLSRLSIVVAASPVIAPPDKEQSERKRGKERRGKER